MEENVNALNQLKQLRMELAAGHRFKTALSGYDKQDVNQFVDRMHAVYEAALTELEAECARLQDANASLSVRLYNWPAPQAQSQPEQVVVEKIVEVPVETVVEKIVEVPVETIVEKIVEIPVEKVVEKIVEKVVEVPAEQAPADSESASLRSRLRGGSESTVARDNLVANLRAANERLLTDNRTKQQEIIDLRSQLDSLHDLIGDSARDMTEMNARMEELMAEKVNACTELLQAWRAEVQDTMDLMSIRVDNDGKYLLPEEQPAPKEKAEPEPDPAAEEGMGTIIPYAARA